jgi:tight adherence protein C
MEDIIYLFILGSVSLVIYGSWSIVINRSLIRQRLPEAASAKRRVLLKASLKPLLKVSDSLLVKLKMKEKLHQKLFAAHVKLNPSEFFAIKLAAVLIPGGLSLLFLKKLGPLAVFIAAGLGYYVVEHWIHKRVAKRRHSIVRLLPETVDLISLCMEAGLDFTTSMDWIVKKTTPTPMIEELAFVVEEIRWGKPRIQALKDMANRLDLPEIRTFVHTLSQAERMGTPVLEVLGMLSEDARMQRFHRGERTALKAPIKMLIPLIFCILPVIGIIVAGPILLRFMESGLGGKF